MSDNKNAAHVFNKELNGLLKQEIKDLEEKLRVAGKDLLSIDAYITMHPDLNEESFNVILGDIRKVIKKITEQGKDTGGHND